MGLREVVQRRMGIVKTIASEDIMSAAFGEVSARAGTITGAESAMKKSAWVYRAVSTVATRIASLPWSVMNGERVMNAAVLNRPNPYQTFAELIEQVVAWQLLGGYGVIYVEPMNIRALPADSLHMEQGSLKAYEGGQWKTLDPKKVVVFPNLSLGGMGLSELAPVLDTANMDESAKTVWNNQMSAGGLLSGLLSTDMKLSEPELSAIKARWEEKYGGAQKAGTMGFLSAGFKFTQMGISAADMRMLEVSQVTRNEIGTAFGVPGIFLGDMSSVDYSNAKTQEKILYTATICPKADRIADRITLFLLPLVGLKGSTFAFDYTGIEALQEDALQRAQVDQAKLTAGTLTINEVRVRDGLDPVKWGDAWWTSAMSVPVLTAERERVEPVASAPAVEPVKMVKGLTPDARKAIALSFLAKTKPQESKFRRVTLQVFHRQEKRIIAWLEGDKAMATKALPAELFDDDELLDEFRPLYMAFALQASEEAAERYLMTKINPAIVREWIRTRGALASKLINETTNADVWDIIASGRANGQSIPDMVKLIEEYFAESGIAGARADTIARTNVIGVNNWSSNETYKENGVTRHEWLATEDDRTRDTHAVADGQVVGIGEPFDIGGSALMYPGDPEGPAEEVCNCRCTVLPVIE